MDKRYKRREQIKNHIYNNNGITIYYVTLCLKRYGYSLSCDLQSTWSSQNGDNPKRRQQFYDCKNIQNGDTPKRRQLSKWIKCNFSEVGAVGLYKQDSSMSNAVYYLIWITSVILRRPMPNSCMLYSNLTVSGWIDITFVSKQNTTSFFFQSFQPQSKWWTISVGIKQL